MKRWINKIFNGDSDAIETTGYYVAVACRCIQCDQFDSIRSWETTFIQILQEIKKKNVYKKLKDTNQTLWLIDGFIAFLYLNFSKIIIYLFLTRSKSIEFHITHINMSAYLLYV